MDRIPGVSMRSRSHSASSKVRRWRRRHSRRSSGSSLMVTDGRRRSITLLKPYTLPAKSSFM
jgi:hypothetical protein